ncbi:ATP-binding protein [Aliiroseovarius sediminis]|uniref:ATP-binding protein n=1 Tax=Aliiroseovarius sediminis TaxID=2925839 RepID=UPI001F58213E|nr:ATP-binding protein [Aliiroseovarius sediminis]MCI2395162.1 ATP-binding protein [Aliiroseovarius sediminis]
MRRLWDRIAPKIWTRLFLMVVAAILLTWIVVGASFYWLGSARGVVTNLSTTQVPRLAQTSRLSAKTADLAMLSNRIQADGAERPEVLEAMLRNSVAELSDFINDGFDTAITRQDADALQHHLAKVIRKVDEAQKIQADLSFKIDQLRWLNADVQDEAAAVMADFAFNIEVLTRRLTREADPGIRREMAQMLTDELALQTTFSNIGNDTGAATTLAIQIATSQSAAQLEQFENLVADALARVNASVTTLPAKAEYLFLRQAAEALGRMTTQPNGVVRDRKAWHQTRVTIQTELDTVLTLLTRMQRQLLVQTETQRADITTLSRNFSANATVTLRLLLAMTVLAAGGGLAILFYYVRPSIIQPMVTLTTAMRQIADGETPALDGLPVRNDEITQLASAVTAFQNSVTERDQAIAKLRQTQSELVQVGKMAALGNLSAGISHELNQPLGAIRQRLRLAQMAAEKGDMARLTAQTETIDALVTRMERIILHLRRFARRSEYQRETVPLARVIRSAQELLAAQIADHQIKFRIDPDLEDATVIADAILLEQVLVNLLSNSCDAIAATGQPGSILIRHEDGGKDDLSFSIVDTGIGLGDLPPERAFDPFVTTKDPGAGLGLGLSISFNIITGMNGTLSLGARADVGTRATVTLPKGGDAHAT